MVEQDFPETEDTLSVNLVNLSCSLEMEILAFCHPTVHLCRFQYLALAVPTYSSPLPCTT